MLSSLVRAGGRRSVAFCVCVTEVVRIATKTGIGTALMDGVHDSKGGGGVLYEN